MNTRFDEEAIYEPARPKASLRFVLLALLARKPESGYGLHREMRVRLSHAWTSRIQQVYTCLQTMESEGSVASETEELYNRPSKKVYSLTPKGEQIVCEWRTIRLDRPPGRDDLLVKLSSLPQHQLPLAVRHLEKRRDDCGVECQLLARRLADAHLAEANEEMGHILSLKAALATTRAELDWCEETLIALQPDGSGHAEGAH